MIRFHYVEGGGFPFFAHVQGAGPEASRRIAFAVVEAVLRKVRLGVGKHCEFFGFKVQQAEAVLQSHCYSAFLARYDGAYLLPNGDFPVGSLCRVEDTDFTCFDVNPIQNVSIPDCAFP